MATDSQRAQALWALLDFTSVKSPTLISERFAQIAEALLHNYYLCIEHQGTISNFELLEIEFYLTKSDVHEDPFCHAHEDQKNTAQWYFHRVPKKNMSQQSPSSTAQGYRGGTRKGLDLTFGATVSSAFFPEEASKFCRGGILLRSMRPRGQRTNVISGPSLLVDKILNITKSDNIRELVNKLGMRLAACPPPHDSSRNENQSSMYFTLRPPGSSGQPPSIHRSPRIGLDLSHPSVSPLASNPRVLYLPRLYRYFIYPELLKANGRCHTLIGLCLEAGLDPTSTSFAGKSPSPESLATSMSMNHATIEKYLDSYREGFKNGSLVKFVGASGKGQGPQLFMKMMGVLARMELLKA